MCSFCVINLSVTYKTINMRPFHYLTTLLLLLAFLPASARQNLRLFMDCGTSPLCDLDYARQQLPSLDFVRDRFNADVQILLSSQPTGNGGEQHTIQFEGQAAFVNYSDTLVFFTAPNAAIDNKRSTFIHHIKLGLIPFLLKNRNTDLIEVNFRKADTAVALRKDPWRNWAFMVGGNVNFSGSSAYKESSYGLDFSVAKVTPSFKTDLQVYVNNSRNTYTYEEGDIKTELKTKNDYYYAEHNFVKSITPHWSWAYKAEYTRSSYDNYKHALELATGMEYNIHPYAVSSNKFLAIRYMLGAEQRSYFDQTLYGKTHERLYFHELGVYAFYVQPWGKLSGSVNWYNYLHDIAKNNLSVYSRVEMNVAKGLSIFFQVTASRIRDQFNLPQKGASSEEVLLRLRSLSTNYNYYTGFGLNYRFGSAVNNIVNARFTSPGM
jgi:hypothetical protein